MTLSNNASALFDPADSGFDYRNDKVRGVNIGNWLLFELWMSPSLANTLNSRVENGKYGDIVDEWTAAQHMSFSSLQSVLTKHYDTWFTEQDMADIAAAGLNHVRLVIPYWSFKEAVGPKAPYYTFNQFAKAKQAVQWAKKYNLKVWIDLHGVPGSQNGYDNSGRSGPIHWANDADYYRRTKVALKKLIDEFTQPAYRGTVTAIEPVNEPAANRNGAVKNLIRQYYPEARDSIRAVGGANTLMAFHDGFLGPKYWEGFFTPNQAKRTILDVHDYFVYGDAQKNKKDIARIRDVCALEGQITRSQGFYPTVVGEMAFNGPSGDRASDRNLPVGPVKFPSGPNYPYSVRYMAFMARNSATQRYVFEKGSGWIAWSWRNDGSLDWSYKTGLQYGWNPRDLNAKPYGNDLCNGYR
ncbi:glycoside hydrolase [Ceraceosorus guamensis]|uniref:Glycoside hydrolase n=1 Tax=Ceraceosorus guamensis TaxID=1522189 RepID=A0A316W4Z5_9BASI|nr:glycoside hydrolase [Ceraceosorus guamensis]PWN44986.1 glycoside hydrolase [Ceraceosorus guamensis]